MGNTLGDGSEGVQRSEVAAGVVQEKGVLSALPLCLFLALSSHQRRRPSERACCGEQAG